MSIPPPYPEPSQAPLAYESRQSQWNAVTIGAVALKLMGVYCLIQAAPMVQLFFYLPTFAPRGFSSLDLVRGFLFYGVQLALAVALIFFTDPLARRLFRGELAQAATIEAPVGPYLQAVAFSILGVWISVDALAKIVHIVMEFNWRWAPRESSNLVEPILKAAGGIFLILRGPGLALLWHKIRTAGVTKD